MTCMDGFSGQVFPGISSSCCVVHQGWLLLLSQRRLSQVFFKCSYLIYIAFMVWSSEVGPRNFDLHRLIQSFVTSALTQWCGLPKLGCDAPCWGSWAASAITGTFKMSVTLLFLVCALIYTMSKPHSWPQGLSSFASWGSALEGLGHSHVQRHRQTSLPPL